MAVCDISVHLWEIPQSFASFFFLTSAAHRLEERQVVERAWLTGKAV